MTARLAALVRRWRVWRKFRHLCCEHERLGYRLSAASVRVYREQAEREVP